MLPNETNLGEERVVRMIGVHLMRAVAIITGVALLSSGSPRLVARAMVTRALIRCLETTLSQPVPCEFPLPESDERARYHIGLNALRLGRPLQAIPPLRAFLIEEPGDDMAGYFLGLAYRRAGNEPAALAAWRRSGSIRAFLAMAWRDGSISDFQTAIALGDRNPATFYKLGEVFIEAGRVSDARAIYAQGIAIDTNNDQQTLLARGRLAELDSDWLKSLAMNEKAIESQPLNADGYYRIGEVYRVRLKQTAKALSWYELCVSRTDSMPCYLGAGEVNRETKNYEAALYWGIRAQKRFLRSAAPLIFIATTWATQGRFAEANLAYEAAASLEPRNFWIPFYQGALAMDGRDFQGAVNYLRHSADLNPSPAYVYLELGHAYRKLGDVRGAVTAYRRVLELLPDEPQAAQALRELGRESS